MAGGLGSIKQVYGIELQKHVRICKNFARICRIFITLKAAIIVVKDFKSVKVVAAFEGLY